MSLVKLILKWLFVLIIFFAVVIFLLRNDTVVQVDFLIGYSYSLQVGMWMILSFISGGILVFLTLWPMLIKQGLIASKTQKKLEKQTDKSQIKGDLVKGN